MLDEYGPTVLDAKTVARRIKSAPGWKTQTLPGCDKPCKIVIIGCNVGTGRDSVAQIVADTLRVEVAGIAGGDGLWSASGQGGYCGVSPDLKHGAYWQNFKPR
jgi:hypothetical protein